jgi:hypothetical protein
VTALALAVTGIVLLSALLSAAAAPLWLLRPALLPLLTTLVLLITAHAALAPTGLTLAATSPFLLLIRVVRLARVILLLSRLTCVTVAVALPLMAGLLVVHEVNSLGRCWPTDS